MIILPEQTDATRLQLQYQQSVLRYMIKWCNIMKLIQNWANQNQRAKSFPSEV